MASFQLWSAGSIKAAAARAAFDAQPKDTIYHFFEYAEEACLVKNASLLKAEKLNYHSSMEKADIYVFRQLLGD